MKEPKEFDDIRPYNDDEVQGVVKELLADRLMNQQLSILIPWMPRGIRNALIRLLFVGVHTTMDFQVRFMKPIIRYMLHKCSSGSTFNHKNIKAGKERYTFVSNHRNIVLDSAILDYMLHNAHFPTMCEIGIGDNLLIYPWIEKVVKLNRAFVVRRGLKAKELLERSKLMSRYIHYAITEKHENIWIAQREGRAKDSTDHTQESVLKMLAMADDRHPAEQLRELNIVPLTISYEYDPCDYLKAQEFQQKRDDVTYRKSANDDEANMRTDIWGFKGHIHYEAAPCINNWLDELKDLPRAEFYTTLAQRMDKEIHRGYRLFPTNYVAADLSRGTNEFASHYKEKDKKKFLKYVDGQIQKVTIPNPDKEFLRERIYTMYANPVFNKQKAME